MSVYFHTVQNINLKIIGSCKEIIEHLKHMPSYIPIAPRKNKPPPQHWIQQSNQLTLLGRTPRCVCTDCLAYFSAQCELILNYSFILLLTNVLSSFQTVYVCEEKQTVHVADIEKDKITECCVGDRILHINGINMSTVQNVMDIIGVAKTGEVIQFDVERSYS